MAAPGLAGGSGYVPLRTPGLPSGVTLQQIDGGPSYYGDNGFTYATSTALTGMSWDDPRFFPIGQDYCFYPSHDPAVFFDLGLNFTHRVTADTDLSVLRAAGVWVLAASDTSTGMGAETFGFHIEEPDTWNGAGDPLSIAAQTAAVTAFPGGLPGRLLHCSFTWNQLFFGTISGAPGDSSMHFVMGSAIPGITPARNLNVASDDLYWFAGSAASGAQQQGYAVENLAQAFGPNATVGQMARGTNYGDMVDIMRTWQVSPSSSSPVIAPYIETEDGLVGAGSREILPAELNWAAWATIIHGARGILYFSTTSNFGSGNTFGFSQTPLSGQSISMYTQGKNTNTLVTRLARIINSPFALNYVTVSPAAYNFPVAVNNATTSGWSVNGIDVMAKYYTGGAFSGPAGSFTNGFYIFATVRNTQATANVPATFTLADGYTGTIHAINADGGSGSYGTRYSLNAANGVFSDTFTAGSSVRIYQVGL